MKKALECIKNNFISIILCAYTILVIMVLLFKIPAGMDIFNPARTRLEMQLIPFKTIIEYASQVHSFTDWFIKNLVCNIVMFIPYGLLLPYIMEPKKLLLKVAIIGTVFSGLIEIIQYIFAIGKFDIDDIILNLLGTILGYVLYLIVEKIRNK